MQYIVNMLTTDTIEGLDQEYYKKQSKNQREKMDSYRLPYLPTHVTPSPEYPV